MKSATIRWIVVLALLSGIGVILTQLFWVRRAYDLKEKEFNINVQTALREVANKVMTTKQVQVPLYSPVEQLYPDYFIVITNVYVEEDMLEHFLTTELTKQHIHTNFSIALYDCMSDTVEYQSYVHITGSKEKRPPDMKMPVIKRDNYYFGVLFPHRSTFLSSQMTFWIISTLFLIGILFFLGYLLFIIFRQKRLSEIQKDFVNNMTHEFKTPLSSIQLSANVLKNPSIVQNPQRLLNYATIISKEASHLTMQVERVLQMAHAEKGDLEIKKEVVVWQHIITHEAESFHDILQQKGGKIHLALPHKEITFIGDQLHLHNVMSNLIDNAIKYNERAPEIRITLREEASSIRIIVEDNGIGIEKEHQKKLFERFFRVPTGNIHNVKGFGLGLDYVKTITKAHGGEVSCTSVIGAGSRFVLSFPQKK